MLDIPYLMKKCYCSATALFAILVYDYSEHMFARKEYTSFFLPRLPVHIKRNINEPRKIEKALRLVRSASGFRISLRDNY